MQGYYYHQGDVNVYNVSIRGGENRINEVISAQNSLLVNGLMKMMIDKMQTEADIRKIELLNNKLNLIKNLASLGLPLDEKNLESLGINKDNLKLLKSSFPVETESIEYEILNEGKAIEVDYALEYKNKDLYIQRREQISKYITEMNFSKCTNALCLLPNRNEDFTSIITMVSPINNWRNKIKNTLKKIQNVINSEEYHSLLDGYFDAKKQDYLIALYSNDKRHSPDHIYYITGKMYDEYISSAIEGEKPINNLSQSKIKKIKSVVKLQFPNFDIDNKKIKAFVEPIIPSSSDINKLYMNEDFETNEYMEINPLFSSDKESILVQYELIYHWKYLI